MTEELDELRELVRQLRADKEHLLQEQAPARATTSDSEPSRPNPNHAHSVSSERLVYLPRERKCPVFRGRAGVGIDEWLEEVDACVRARHLGSLDEAYFMFDHLDGEAKDEIRYRPRADREDPDRISSILKELYGCSKSYVALQEEFFSRKQLDGETLQEYSHSLFSLMEKVKQVSPESVPQSDRLLRDQFVEHVIDSDLRRELKRLVRQTPVLSMLEVRAAAIRWECEGRPSEVTRGRSYSVPSICSMQYSRTQPSVPTPVITASSEMAELRAMLLKQQEQINQLTSTLASWQGPAQPTRPSRPSPVICRRCQKSGHYARECDNERVFVQGPAAPAQTRPDSAPTSQGAGN